MLNKTENRSPEALSDFRLEKCRATKPSIGDSKTFLSTHFETALRLTSSIHLAFFGVFPSLKTAYSGETLQNLSITSAAKIRLCQRFSTPFCGLFRWLLSTSIRQLGSSYVFGVIGGLLRDRPSYLASSRHPVPNFASALFWLSGSIVFFLWLSALIVFPSLILHCIFRRLFFDPSSFCRNHSK